ncbi:hypothetical protein ACROYT_G008124 [Oculina patagonica]
MWAVAKSIESLPVEVRDCRIDIQVDNQAIIHTWHGRSSRSKDLNRVAQRIFSLVSERNIALSLHYVPSGLNAADWFSRRLSRQEAMLSPRCWQIVQAEFGGERGHTLDLMALDSNVMRDKLGRPLKHFTPYPTPGSAGINVFNQDLRECDGIVINAGKTKVHLDSCPAFGTKNPLKCACPTRLAFGTVDSLIGKLRAIFAALGHGSDDSGLPGYGNPAASRVVKDYLTSVREEQLQARISPSQAELFFLTDVVAVAEHICSRLKNLTPTKAKLQLYKAAILPHLIFCHLVWHFCRASDTRRLERIQKRGLRAVFKDDRSSYEVLLKRAELHTLKNRRLQDICILMYKVKNGLSPNPIRQLFNPHQSSYQLRQSDFSMPRFTTVTYGKHSIRYLGPKLWGHLMTDERNCQSLKTFKKTIRKRDFNNFLNNERCNCRLCDY